MGSTASRAVTSTTAVKPSAAAARVAAARAAAKSSKPIPKGKAPSGTKKEVNKNETNIEDGKPNGTEENEAIISPDTTANADNVDLISTDQVLETVNKNVN